jgi:drug/metabolite transporter (DMT)-like permease
MAIVFALACAFVYGVADYAGGRGARFASPASVTATAQAAGMAVLLPALLLFDGSLTTRSLVVGALGGMSGEVGLMLLYSALARGAMSVVSPIAALVSALVPVIAGLMIGESMTSVHLLGVMVALLAIGLISRGGAVGPAAPSHHARPSPAVLLMSLCAGLGFGLFIVALDRAGDDAGVWPLIAARPVGTMLAAGYAVAAGLSPVARGVGGRLALAAGACDALANIFALLAAQSGKLAVAGLIVSMYPASTVVLSTVLDREPIRRLQLVGFALAAAAVVLIAT